MGKLTHIGIFLPSSGNVFSNTIRSFHSFIRPMGIFCGSPAGRWGFLRVGYASSSHFACGSEFWFSSSLMGTRAVACCCLVEEYEVPEVDEELEVSDDAEDVDKLVFLLGLTRRRILEMGSFMGPKTPQNISWTIAAQTYWVRTNVFYGDARDSDGILVGESLVGHHFRRLSGVKWNNATKIHRWLHHTMCDSQAHLSKEWHQILACLPLCGWPILSQSRPTGSPCDHPSAAVSISASGRLSTYVAQSSVPPPFSIICPAKQTHHQLPHRTGSVPSVKGVSVAVIGRSTATCSAASGWYVTHSSDNADDNLQGLGKPQAEVT
ncbi:hypothetical protein V8F33_010513 [Rhypophila sp. PSN 637]